MTLRRSLAMPSLIVRLRGAIVKKCEHARVCNFLYPSYPLVHFSRLGALMIQMSNSPRISRNGLFPDFFKLKQALSKQAIQQVHA